MTFSPEIAVKHHVLSNVFTISFGWLYDRLSWNELFTLLFIHIVLLFFLLLRAIMSRFFL